MPHSHLWRTLCRLPLSVPDTAGRVELFNAFACACGASTWATSWSRTTGRHLTCDELREVGRQERVYGQGQARRDRARG
jgi:hypothetical protein